MGIVFKNNAKTTLASGITDTATSATVVDGSVFPSLGAGEYFFCTFDNGTQNEIVKVTARSGNTLTIVRAQDNTTARSFLSGHAAELRVTAGVLENIQENIAAKSANQTIYSTTTASSATSYDIGIDPGVEANASVFLDGVYQHHDTFSFSGSTLTFDAAPVDGTALEVIVDNLINLQSSNLSVDTFTAADVGGNPQTDFTLSDVPGAETNLIVFVDGVFQNQDSYTFSNNTLTMTDGVTADRVVTVYIINPVNIGTPSDGTITSAKLSGDITFPGDITVTGDVAFDSPTFVVDNVNSRVGIGTAAPSTLLDIVGDVKMSADLTVDTSTLHVDSANNRVGIGTTSPDYKLEINHTGANTLALVLNDGDTVSNATGLYLRSTSEGRISVGSGAALTFAGNGGSSEYMRIDSSGNVLVGKTSADNGATVGIEMTTTDKLYVTDSASSPIIGNRLSSDGNVIVVQKDGTAVGTLAARIGDLVIGNNDVGLRFSDGGDSILPAQSGSTGDRDNAIDLGASGARFKSLYLRNFTWNDDQLRIPSASGGDGDIFLGAYLHIYGRNKSNTAAITLNTTYDGAETDTYTPIYSGNAGAGQLIMKQSAGGEGSLRVYVKTHGTNSASAALSTFTQIADFNDAGYFNASNGLYVNGASVVSTTNDFSLNGGNWSGNDRFNLSVNQFDAGATFQTGEFILFGDHDGSADKMLTLKRAGSDVFTVNSGGNVGIGTTSPAGVLDLRTGIGYNASADRTFHVGANNLGSVDIGSYFGYQWKVSGAASGQDLLLSANRRTGASSEDLRDIWHFDASARAQIFLTDHAERMRIDSSGNVGIGTDSPAVRLHAHSNIEETIRVDGSAGKQAIHFRENGTLRGIVGFSDGSAISTSLSDNDFAIRAESNLGFVTGGANLRMLIDSSGDVLINTTAAFSGGKLDVRSSTSNTTEVIGVKNDNSGSYNVMMKFYAQSTAVGRIDWDNTGGFMAFTNLSDGRLKNVTGEARGLDLINKLNPVKYYFKDNDWESEGLVAQEVEQAYKDLGDTPVGVRTPESDDDYYQLSTSHFVVNLIKAVKEQQEQIEQLKGRIEELENG